MDFDGIPVTTEASEKQLLDYRESQEDFLSWLLAYGKNPKTATGYSRATVRRTAYRTNQLNRWMWDEEGHYTMSVDHDHADAYMKELAYGDKSTSGSSNG